MKIIELGASVLSVVISAHVVTADTNLPLVIGPRTILTNSAPVYLRNAYFSPPALGAASSPQSPTATTNFPALFGGNEIADT